MGAQLMKDAGVLDDEHCTVRAVTSFFVIVNMDDGESAHTGPCKHTHTHVPMYM